MRERPWTGFVFSNVAPRHFQGFPRVLTYSSPRSIGGKSAAPTTWSIVPFAAASWNMRRVKKQKVMSTTGLFRNFISLTIIVRKTPLPEMICCGRKRWGTASQVIGSHHATLYVGRTIIASPPIHITPQAKRHRSFSPVRRPIFAYDKPRVTSARELDP